MHECTHTHIYIISIHIYLYITGNLAPGAQVAVIGASKVILRVPWRLLSDGICFYKVAKPGRLEGNTSSRLSWAAKMVGAFHLFVFQESDIFIV